VHVCTYTHARTNTHMLTHIYAHTCTLTNARAYTHASTTPAERADGRTYPVFHIPAAEGTQVCHTPNAHARIHSCTRNKHETTRFPPPLPPTHTRIHDQSMVAFNYTHAYTYIVTTSTLTVRYTALRTHTHTHAHTRTHTHTHAHTRTRTHTRTHMHTSHTYAHTHTH
jgi:hypothetical protein